MYFSKANMNTCKPYKTAAIFLSNLYLKQGIGYLYVMVDIFAWASSSCEEREVSENYKMNFFFHSGIRTTNLPLTKRTFYQLHHDSWQ